MGFLPTQLMALTTESEHMPPQPVPGLKNLRVNLSWGRQGRLLLGSIIGDDGESDQAEEVGRGPSCRCKLPLRAYHQGQEVEGTSLDCGVN